MTDDQYRGWQERISAARTEEEFRALSAELEGELGALGKEPDPAEESALWGIGEQLSMVAASRGVELDPDEGEE